MGCVMAQLKISTVDLQKIDQKKIRTLLNQQNLQANSFTELSTSVNIDDELLDYKRYEKSYTVKEDLNFVWDIYNFSCQTDIWDLNKISFAMLYNEGNNSLIYANQDCVGLQPGQIFYLNLKIAHGFYNLPVSFKIIRIDHEEKVIELSYLKGGKTSGKQVIKLIETEDGNTNIIHQSMVKSNSSVRDKYLYPYFHNKLINEFHANMKRIITRQRKASIELLAESN